MHHEQLRISRQCHLNTPQAVSRRVQMLASCLLVIRKAVKLLKSLTAPLKMLAPPPAPTREGAFEGVHSMRRVCEMPVFPTGLEGCE